MLVVDVLVVDRLYWDCRQLGLLYIEALTKTTRGILRFEGFYGKRFCEGWELRSQAYVPPSPMVEPLQEPFLSARGDIVLGPAIFFSATTHRQSTIAILVG